MVAMDVRLSAPFREIFGLPTAVEKGLMLPCVYVDVHVSVNVHLLACFFQSFQLVVTGFTVIPGTCTSL